MAGCRELEGIPYPRSGSKQAGRLLNGRDAEDRNLVGDPAEVLKRTVAVDRDVGPGSRRQRQVASQDSRPVTDGNLFKVQTLALAVA